MNIYLYRFKGFWNPTAVRSAVRKSRISFITVTVIWIKIVNRSVGMSLLEYRKFFMIKEAARLLSCTDKTISEIIDDLGFSGHTYFNSFFKNNTVLRLPNIGKTASYDQNEDPFFVNWNRSTKYPILSFMKSIVLIIVFIYWSFENIRFRFQSSSWWFYNCYNCFSCFLQVLLYLWFF